MKANKRKKPGLFIILTVILVVLYSCGVSDNNNTSISQDQTVESPAFVDTTESTDTTNVANTKETADSPTEDSVTVDETLTTEDKLSTEEDSSVYRYKDKTYTVIEVDGGDLSGERQSNVAVNIGYGDRVYWALTNKYGQLEYVIADEIVLQDDKNEPVLSSGRYYKDEAKVPGTERPDYDEGHVIADSLGGVSNAYNITPQNSVLNRHGDQAYMEKIIRDAGGCVNFVATITYPDTKTQIPSSYKYEYEIDGRKIVDEFDNIDPDEVNRNLASTKNDSSEKNKIDKKNGSKSDSKNDSSKITDSAKKVDSTKKDDSKKDDSKTINASTGKASNTVSEKEELKKIDTNGNGKVTIAEAKAAGYSMPIYSDHWLYKYMDDRDGDGMVGE